MKFNWQPLFEMDTGASGGGDSGGDLGGAPAPATPSVASAPPVQQGTNPLLDDLFGQPPAEPQAPMLGEEPPAAPTVEELDFAGRKVPVVDPVIREIHKDYSNLAKTYQETNQSVRQLQEQNQMYQQMIQYFQQQGQQPQQAQAPAEPPAPSPEDNEQFMSQWYDSPISTVQQLIERQVQSLVESQVKPIIEPIQRERQYSQELQQLASKHSDFQEHLPVMQQIVQSNPNLASQGLETVYWVAKGQNVQPQQPTYTPDQLLQDPQFRQQLLGDEKLRNEIVSSYMQQRQQTNQQVPPVMGNQPGGSPPAMPDEKPKTIREASKMFSRYLGL